MGGPFFPYGNDLRSPGSWLGSMDAKSRYWYATYIGGWPVSALLNGHTIVIFGTESLSAAVVTLYTFGLQGSIGPGKIVKWLRGRSRTWEGAERAQRNTETARDLNGRREHISQIQEINSAVDIFNICMGHGEIIKCDTPMSLNDLAGAGGAIAGGEIEMAGKASVYIITAESGANVWFGDKQVYNLGGGFLGASAAIAGGIWSVRAPFSAANLFDPDNDRPLEVIRDGENKTILELQGAMSQVSLDDKPFYRYIGAPNYIRELPGLYGGVPDDIVRLGEEYAEDQRGKNGG